MILIHRFYDSFSAGRRYIPLHNQLTEQGCFDLTSGDLLLRIDSVETKAEFMRSEPQSFITVGDVAAHKNDQDSTESCRNAKTLGPLDVCHKRKDRRK